MDVVGVEGTGSYGAGLVRALRAADVAVVEVDRPDRKTRRLRGKSDPIDAEAAARAALAGTATGTPKTRDGAVEAIRVLEVAYASAVADATRATNQFTALVVTAPEAVRAQLESLSLPQQLERARRFVDRADHDPLACEMRYALRELARRLAALHTQQADLDQHLQPLVAAAAPALIGLGRRGRAHRRRAVDHRR